MEKQDQYKAVMAEVIAKQSVILGLEMAVMRAKKIPEIEVGPNGEVKNITGDPADALKHLIDSYVELSGQIVRNALGPIFTKYPGVMDTH